MSEATPAAGPVQYHRAHQRVTDELLAGWEVTKADDGRIARISGPCPRCGDHTEHLVAEGVVEGLVAGILPLPPAKERLTQKCDCTCELQHLGPANENAEQAGCGAWWTCVIVRNPRPGEQPVRAPADDTLLEAAQAAALSSGTGESALRASGEKWIGAVTAIIGLFGLAGVVSGKEAFAGLPVGVRAVTGAAGFLALLAAARAIWNSYTAAYGWPVWVDIRDDAELAAWYAKHQARMRAAPAKLRAGVSWAMVALGLLIGVAACVWFWPRETSTPQVIVQLTGASQVCGSLVSSDGPAQLRVRRPDGTVLTIRSSMVQSVTPAASCPG